MFAHGANSPILKLFPNIFLINDSPAFVTTVMIAAVLLSALYAVGFKDRYAAIGLWWIWTSMIGRDPLINNPGLHYVGLILVIHALLPTAPYGSLDARGKVDPGSKWYLPGPLFFVAWFLMAAGYTYSGYTKLVSPSWVSGTAFAKVLVNPLARPWFLDHFLLALPSGFLYAATWGALCAEIAFTFLAFSRKLRPFAWLMLLLMHLGLISLINFADLSLGMVMLHLFTFDASWLPGKKKGQTDRLFYDGNCGLCHRAIRLLLAEDRVNAFVFSPLDSEVFTRELTDEQRKDLPDSMVVRTTNGAILIKSGAWLYILARLGGWYRVLGFAVGLIPRSVSDGAYDFIAARRKKVFGTKKDACPLMPPDFRKRFEF
jgi:predicted DCC family thiol-disulfide oxidoreductase YuxK